MHDRERYSIGTNECITEVVPNRTKQEYRKVNFSSIKEYHRQHRHVNIIQIIAHVKAYREANKEKIKLRDSKLCKSPCGLKYIV